MLIGVPWGTVAGGGLARVTSGDWLAVVPGVCQVPLRHTLPEAGSRYDPSERISYPSGLLRLGWTLREKAVLSTGWGAGVRPGSGVYTGLVGDGV